MQILKSATLKFYWFKKEENYPINKAFLLNCRWTESEIIRITWHFTQILPLFNNKRIGKQGSSLSLGENIKKTPPYDLSKGIEN